MINEILKGLSISALPWVERYGGLARTVTRYTEEAGKVKYPVSAQVSNEQLYEEGRYLDLVPNDAFYSILYFEQLTDTALKETTLNRRKKAHDFSVQMRVVAWLNLQKLGVVDTSASYAATLDVLKALKEPITLPPTSKLDGLAFKIQADKMLVEPKDVTRSAVFNKYHYADDERLFFYPYDFFSIKFVLSWNTALDCPTGLTPTTPIKCVDLTA